MRIDVLDNYPAKNNQCCYKCRFCMFDIADAGQVSDSNDLHHIQGVCQRNPPVVFPFVEEVPLAKPFGETRNAEAHDSFVYRQPKVDLFADWCGEFKPRKIQ